MKMLQYNVTAIQFVLTDEFSHMRPEERQQLLHVSNGITWSHWHHMSLYCRRALVLGWYQLL